MKGFSRSLKYFTVLALQLAGVLTLLLALLVVLRFVSIKTSVSGDSALSLFILFLCAIFGPAYGIGLYIWVPSHVISFSCTRRNLFWGCLWLYTLLIMVICAANGMLFLILTGRVDSLFLGFLPYSIGLLAGSGGIGTLFGGFIAYFRKAGLILATILLLVLSAAAGFFSSVLSYYDFVYEEGNAYIVLLAGIILFIVGAAVNYVFLRRASVR